MELEMVLIRSGKTVSAAQGRRLGQLDEPLIDIEKDRITKRAAEKRYPEVELVFASRMLRSRQTAELIYPHIPHIILPDLAPMDVGIYAGQALDELASDKQFAQWLQSELEKGKALGGGEQLYQFQARCVRCFRYIVKEIAAKGIASVGVVTHCDVIAAMLQRYHIPRQFYRDWTPDYGGGYVMQCDSRHPSANFVEKL